MNKQSMFHRMIRSSLMRVVRRETERISGSWVLLFTTLVGPVASFLLITWMFSGGVVRDLPISVVDMDQTQLSRKIARMADATPAVNVTSRPTSLEEARAAMNRGETEAVLVIPEGTEKDVQKGVQSEIALYINNTNVVKGGVIQSQMVNALATVSAVIKIQTMVKKGVNPETAIKRAQPIRPDVHLLYNPYGNYAYFLMMGLLPLLAVVFIFFGSAYTIGIELKDGTATEWLSVAEGSTSVALIGKLIPYVLLFFVDLMVMNILLIKVMGTPLNGSLTMILFSELLLILAYQATALLFLSLTINLRLTLSLGSAYTMMALTFSGLTFPAMGMTLVAKIFAVIFPYNFWLKIFLSQSLRGEPVDETLWPLFVLTLFIWLGVASLPFFKRRFHDERWQTKD
ncbi:MAG: ABC transporter permease [Marinilabiliales bacterium]|nr:ABC transporter permease [Marinilabiliales bacterium]